MKFLHTSDWHLGRVSENKDSLYEDQKFMLERIREVAEKEQVDGVLLAGDILDKSVAAKEALSLWDEATYEICKGLGIPIYAIAGNHDGAERLSVHDRLLQNGGLYIAGMLEAEPHRIQVDGVSIFLLPWITTEQVRAVYPEKAEEIKTMEDAYRVVLDDYRSRFIQGEKNILVSHSFVLGGTTSVSDQAAELGLATQVGTGLFDGFDYVALGHLHGPQRITDKMYYSGTPMAYSFGREESQEKSVIIYDTEADEDDRIRFVPLKQRHARLTLTGTFDELMSRDVDVLIDDDTKKRVKACMPEDMTETGEYIADGYLKLDVTDCYIGYEARAKLSTVYPCALVFTGTDYTGKETVATRLSASELAELETEPAKLFESYFTETFDRKPDDHIMKIFEEAMQAYATGEAE